MKKLLITTTVLLGGLAANAYDYPYLTLQKADGTEISLSVEQLQLTFSNGQLTATNSDGSQSIALTELSKMFFSEYSSGITTLSDSDATDTSVKVYTTGGIFVGRFESTAKAKDSLRPGIYIIKAGEKTIKATVK